MDKHCTSKQAERVVEGPSLSPLGSQPSLNTQLTQPTSSTGNSMWRSHTWAWWLFVGGRWSHLHLVLNACLVVHAHFPVPFSNLNYS